MKNILYFFAICAIGASIGGCATSQSGHPAIQTIDFYKPATAASPSSATNEQSVPFNYEKYKKWQAEQKQTVPPAKPKVANTKTEANAEASVPAKAAQTTYQPAARHNSASDPPTEFDDRLTRLERTVETNTRVLGATQKLVFNNQKKIGWLEAYQRKMDERLAELTWNGADRRLTPIRIGNFGSGSAVLTKRLMAQTKASTKRLALIAQKAKNDGKTLTIKVLGYASQGGKSKNNMALSLKRAKAVADELRKGGINVTTVEGKGEISVGLYSRTNQCVRILPGIN